MGNQSRPSILGTDPETDYQPAPEPQEDTTSPEDAVLSYLKDKHGISSLEELDLWRQKKDLYDQMDGDPGLARVVRDYYQGNQNTQTSAEDTNMEDSGWRDEIRKDIDSLKDMFRQDFARRQVDAFKQARPDYEQYKTGMQRVLQQYPNMSLEDAYTFAKHQGAAASPSTPVQRPTGGVETTESAAIPRKSSREEIEAKINDPRISTEDAIRLAMEFEE